MNWVPSSDRALYLIGAPGSGKSTVMRSLISELGLRSTDELHVCRETYATWLEDEAGERPAWMWGRWSHPKFPGTDTLGRACSGYARRWMEDGGVMPSLVIGEGVKLGTIRFLLALDSFRPLTIGFLSAPEETLQQRCIERDGDLDAGYKLAMGTRAARLAGDFEALGLPVLRINTGELTAQESAQKLVEAVSY